MQPFKDALGRDWTLAITVLDVRELKKELQVDVLDLNSGHSTVLQRLATEDELLVDVLEVLLKEQILNRKLTPRQFAEGLVGEGIQRATDSLVEAIINFMRPQQGAVMRALWEKVQATNELATAKVLERVEELDTAALVDQSIDRAFATAPMKSGT